eukprot:TRINITY_DN9064_c0_g1_i1.p1 TRINITY_DN9064_c0_g1~~TRINITY_DN9064_c0_g1_i1.p1  ORF type:complete len:197 (-),score=34.55 TRINITY_DN9064_c0_g1_i1:53-643(-)
MAVDRACLLLALTLLLGCATIQIAQAQNLGVKKVADILVALEKQGNYNSFIYALKATGVDGDLAKFLNNYNSGLTILAADDSAFPDAVQARNAVQLSVDLRRVISSHIIMEYLPTERLAEFEKNHMFATMGRPLHVVHPGALSASVIGQEGIEGKTTFAEMRGAVATITDKDIYNGDNISIQGVGVLLLPSATPSS